MIPPIQRDALALLAEVCAVSPDVRLGQLVAHLGFLGQDRMGRSLWDIEDDQLLEVLRHHLAELQDRTTAPMPNPTPPANSACSSLAEVRS